MFQITVHMPCLVNVFKMEMRFIMKILTGFCFVVSVVGVRVHLNELQCARACQMIQDGRTQRDVATELRVSQSYIRNVWRRFQETQEYRRRRGSGRPRATTAVDDRYLTISARRNPFQSARRIQNEFRQATHVTISSQTVRNRLREVGLRSRVPRVVPRMTAEHRRRRLDWARTHSRWTVEQWSNILFTDESRFTVDHSDGGSRVWRGVGQRYDPQFTVAVNRWGGGSVMVWAGVSVTERTELHFVQGNMNAHYYRDNVLETIILPYRNRVGDRFLLMDDNARPHRARIITTFLEDHNIQRMEWPAMSPDLNPIENIWAMLGTRVRNRNPAVTNVETLRVALQEEWNNIPQVLIRNTVVSMRRRCLECINLNGASTHY